MDQYGSQHQHQYQYHQQRFADQHEQNKFGYGDMMQPEY